VENWTFLTNHARVLLCIAHDPGVRLRDIAVSLDITERRAYGIVTDLTGAGIRRQAERRPPQPLPDPGAHTGITSGQRSTAGPVRHWTRRSSTQDQAGEPYLLRAA
jgi:hypothetical protein